jgi:ribosomal protein S18 acetylase RimI-like enzyme
VTPDSVLIRRARPDDAARIVYLVRSGFSAELVEAFIYGCHGIERYVRSLIEDRTIGVDTHYEVAESSSGVVGCIEMRELKDGLCLNYVAVDAGFRSARLGSRLLRHAIQTHGHERTLVLDVLEHNHVARKWYAALGMEQEGSTEWFAAPLPSTAGASPAALVTGLPQARLLQEQLGFSLFQVACDGRRYEVGMLGARWFRVTTAEALRDPALGAVLRRVDDTRELLALLPGGNASPPAARRLTRTLRLSATLATVSARLAREDRAP